MVRSNTSDIFVSCFIVVFVVEVTAVSTISFRSEAWMRRLTVIILIKAHVQGSHKR